MAYVQQSRNALRRIATGGTSFLKSDKTMHHPLLFACQGVRYRKLENVEKLGKAGETVKVALGFFRKHLMPKLLAVPNIDKLAHLIREQRKIYQPKEAEEDKVVKKTVEDKTKEYEKAAKRLADARLVCEISFELPKLLGTLLSLLLWISSVLNI